MTHFQIKGFIDGSCSLVCSIIKNKEEDELATIGFDDSFGKSDQERRIDRRKPQLVCGIIKRYNIIAVRYGRDLVNLVR